MPNAQLAGRLLDGGQVFFREADRDIDKLRLFKFNVDVLPLQFLGVGAVEEFSQTIYIGQINFLSREVVYHAPIRRSTGTLL